MKTASLRLSISVIAMTAFAIGAARAEDISVIPAMTNAPAPAASPAAAPAPQATSEGTAQPQAPAAPTLSHEQLDQLVAPIALYPDQLLGQILMASTYPLEVVEAARWVAAPANKVLQGQALSDAVKGQNWDPSVMALAPFPNVLKLMDGKRSSGPASSAMPSPRSNPT